MRLAAHGARPLVVLAAGGTGGHMFPAEALAGALIGQGYAVALITDQRGQAFGDALAAVAVYRIRASRLPRHTMDRVKAVFSMALGLLDARSLLKRLQPVAVVGFGGYPSIPTVAAASLQGVPIVLHEQNAVLGRANRRLAGRAKAIATAFERVSRIPEKVSVELVGNPVRPAIASVRAQPYRAKPDGRFSLLVVGGSQGARIFSELIPAATSLMPEAARSRLRIAQQCRPEDIEAARAAYATVGVETDLRTFFTDMPERLAACDLAITRSGASTVAELGVAGRPAILVPYPFATDDHQTANAEAYAAGGGAWVMGQRSLTPAFLAERLGVLMNNPDTLVRAAEAARRTGRPDAADRLASVVMRCAMAGRAEATAGSLEDAAT
jgi:UDP-N-acetylglucosamine--N-acetylmuramyl-(pentapeptide) pyrophosphoryl-undecaprenol N-acetylglucosamine transferase